MRSHMKSPLVTILLLLVCAGIGWGQTLDQLGENDQIAGFRVEAVYENELNQVMGARFRHATNGFVLDFLRIQSLPQAFMWVNTPPPSDRGEPHTLEHLLLGKGNKGRYVASLEDMSLGSSSAFTMQMRTCYHFNTSAGTDVFFNLFETKLDAMLYPNFSDEEIRREVCNMGVKLNSTDGSVSLEEKGTVYTEMVSSYERPWGDLYRKLSHLLFGEKHPLAMESGGLPAAIREMRPEHIRAFHAATHHLNNMGAVVALPDQVSLESALKTFTEIMARLEPDAKETGHPDEYQKHLPAATFAPAGAPQLVSFPHQNENEPCLVVCSWNPTRSMAAGEEYLMDLMLDNLANGQTSNLFNRFVNSEKKIIDIGTDGTFAWYDRDPGFPIFVGMNNVRREATTPDMLDSLRGLILAEIRMIAELPDNSEELLAFNERALNRVTQRRKGLRDMLNSPPRFGFRGTGSGWMDHLLGLHKKGGFRRSLMVVDELDYAVEQLKTGSNIWKELIGRWHLLTEPPHVVATRPSPERMVQADNERNARVAQFVTELNSRYGVESTDEAIAAYQKDYTVETDKIDEKAAEIEMPSFIDNPPMTLDDQLQYTVETLPGGGDLVVSTFDNMTSATAGLVFDMYVVPESLLIYLPALPSLMTGSGLYKDGRTIGYDEMQESVRREILGLNAYYASNLRTERVELVLRTEASTPQEVERAVVWLNDVLFNPNLRMENISRIRDVIDLAIGAASNRMRGSEESWVNEPARAFWKQTNPLLLSTNCFLTEAHALHRLRWQLKDFGDDPTQFADFMRSLSTVAKGRSKSEVVDLLNALAGAEESNQEAIDANLKNMYETASDGNRSLMNEALKDLRRIVADLPEATLQKDVAYLCRQIASDLTVHPRIALAGIEEILALIRSQKNLRGFIVANKLNQTTLRTGIDATVEKLSDVAPAKQTYTKRPFVVDRLRDHSTGSKPVFVGLINEGTRNGVHINTSDCASFEDNDDTRLLKFLSARLYGGGGAHSMFMKTWGAGLAYSNGLRSDEYSGRLSYYAERCPDLSQTMQFVVGELEKARKDPSLASYAVAQAFAVIRSGSRYGLRGEAMASDLADGLTPEKVTRFRQKVLQLKDSPGLYDTLYDLMPETYGEVLPGYGVGGKKAADRSNAFYYVIGPESQLANYEEYLKKVEGDDTQLHRLYQRDYWIPAEELIN